MNEEKLKEVMNIVLEKMKTEHNPPSLVLLAQTLEILASISKKT